MNSAQLNRQLSWRRKMA